MSDKYKKLLAEFNELKKDYSKLEELVYKDSLTKLYNQKFMYEVLDRKIQEHKRYKEEFAVLFLDIDHFKKVNDGNGHYIGSSILVELGDLILSQLRKTDYAFRYGGDEFVLVLNKASIKQALFVAEKLRKEIEKKVFHIDKEELNITISVGIAHVPTHANKSKEIIQMADQAMYESKKGGRNRVYLFNQ